MCDKQNNCYPGTVITNLRELLGKNALAVDIFIISFYRGRDDTLNLALRL